MKITEEKNVTQWAASYNEGTAGIIGPLDIQYAFANWRTIVEEVKSGRSADLLALSGKCKGPALLLGSGPSLDDALPLFKDWKGAICCSTSQASSCVYYGRSPDWMVMLDAQTNMGEFQVDKWGSNTAMILNPSMPPEVMANWAGPKFYYRQMDPSNPFYSKILPIAYPFIKTELLLFSCTPGAQLGILRNMGYNPIFLVGLDMGFPGNKYRCTWWKYRDVGGEMKHGKWRPKATRWVADPPATRPDNLIRAKNGVLTESIHLFFKRAIFAVTSLECHRPEAPQILYASKGIFDEFPVVPIEEVIERQGQGYEHLFRTNEEQAHICEKYLASVRMYTIRFTMPDGSQGTRFFETENWRLTLPQYIGQMTAQGVPIEPWENAEARIDAIEKEIEAEGGYIAKPTETEAREVTP